MLSIKLDTKIFILLQIFFLYIFPMFSSSFAFPQIFSRKKDKFKNSFSEMSTKILRMTTSEDADGYFKIPLETVEFNRMLASLKQKSIDSTLARDILYKQLLALTEHHLRINPINRPKVSRKLTLWKLKAETILEKSQFSLYKHFFPKNSLIRAIINKNEKYMKNMFSMKQFEASNLFTIATCWKLHYYPVFNTKLSLRKQLKSLKKDKDKEFCSSLLKKKEIHVFFTPLINIETLERFLELKNLKFDTLLNSDSEPSSFNSEKKKGKGLSDGSTYKLLFRVLNEYQKYFLISRFYDYAYNLLNDFTEKDNAAHRTYKIELLDSEKPNPLTTIDSYEAICPLYYERASEGIFEHETNLNPHTSIPKVVKYKAIPDADTGAGKYLEFLRYELIITKNNFECAKRVCSFLQCHSVSISSNGKAFNTENPNVKTNFYTPYIFEGSGKNRKKEIQKEIQKKIQMDIQKKIQKEIQKEIREEIQEEMQTEMQTEMQMETQMETQMKMLKANQKKMLKEIQKEMQGDLLKKVQKDLLKFILDQYFTSFTYTLMFITDNLASEPHATVYRYEGLHTFELHYSNMGSLWILFSPVPEELRKYETMQASQKAVRNEFELLLNMNLQDRILIDRMNQDLRFF